ALALGIPDSCSGTANAFSVLEPRKEDVMDALQNLQTVALVAGGTIVFLLVLLRLGMVTIGERESGLVVRRYGRPLPPGRIIAIDSEAGYQARMLPPGWHFPLWRWKYKVER